MCGGCFFALVPCRSIPAFCYGFFSGCPPNAPKVTTKFHTVKDLHHLTYNTMKGNRFEPLFSEDMNYMNTRRCIDVNKYLPFSSTSQTPIIDTKRNQILAAKSTKICTENPQKHNALNKNKFFQTSEREYETSHDQGVKRNEGSEIQKQGEYKTVCMNYFLNSTNTLVLEEDNVEAIELLVRILENISTDGEKEISIILHPSDKSDVQVGTNLIHDQQIQHEGSQDLQQTEVEGMEDAKSINIEFQFHSPNHDCPHVEGVIFRYLLPENCTAILIKNKRYFDKLHRITLEYIDSGSWDKMLHLIMQNYEIKDLEFIGMDIEQTLNIIQKNQDEWLSHHKVPFFCSVIFSHYPSVHSTQLSNLLEVKTKYLSLENTQINGSGNLGNISLYPFRRSFSFIGVRNVDTILQNIAACECKIEHLLVRCCHFQLLSNKSADSKEVSDGLQKSELLWEKLEKKCDHVVFGLDSREQYPFAIFPAKELHIDSTIIDFDSPQDLALNLSTTFGGSSLANHLTTIKSRFPLPNDTLRGLAESCSILSVYSLPLTMEQLMILESIKCEPSLLFISDDMLTGRGLFPPIYYVRKLKPLLKSIKILKLETPRMLLDRDCRKELESSLLSMEELHICLVSGNTQEIFSEEILRCLFSNAPYFKKFLLVQANILLDVEFALKMPNDTLYWFSESLEEFLHHNIITCVDSEKSNAMFKRFQDWVQFVCKSNQQAHLIGRSFGGLWHIRNRAPSPYFGDVKIEISHRIESLHYITFVPSLSFHNQNIFQND